MWADIAFEAEYPLAPELIWRAIATPEGLGAWLMANTFEHAERGHRFRFNDRPRPFWDGICECEVVEAEAARSLRLKWGTNTGPHPTEVSWTLTPTKSGGTHLAFRHAGLHGFMGFMMKQGMTKGWKRMVEHSIPFVAERLTQGTVPSRDEVRAESLRRR